MTGAHGSIAGTRFVRLTTAEFLKIWASRIPLAVLLILPVLTYASALELYHVERVAERLAPRNALDALPLLFFASSKTLLFLAAIVTFAAFWSTLDSQYGMVRVACAQPIGRVEYLAAKWCGIAAHVTLFALALVLSHLLWACLYSGVSGLNAGAGVAIARFTAEVVLFTLSIAWVAMAASSFRRTVGAGLVTGILAMAALALMTIVPFEVLPPRFVLMRYYFYPLGELPNPWPAEPDSPFARVMSPLGFLLVVTVTPLVVALPAAMHFARRDITE